MLNKEAAKLHELLKSIHDNKNKEDKIWDNFCKEMNKDKEKPQPKRNFKKHPTHISNSSSEILSPRVNNKLSVRRDVKSVNSIKLIESPDTEASDASMEIVTIRKESPLMKQKFIKCESPRPSTRRRSMSRNRSNSRTKQAKIDAISFEEPPKIKILLPATKFTPTTTTKVIKSINPKKKEEKHNEAYRDNFEAKLHSVVSKSLLCMEDIRAQLDSGVTLPDGFEDLERRKRRSTEFASRFSRNYLYELNRQISELRKLSKPNSAKTDSQTNTVKQKLASSYQTVLQGLQAYLNHLPVATTIAVPEKIKDLLKEIPTLCDIQRSIATHCESDTNNNEVVDIFEVRSRCLTEKIEEYFATASAISMLDSPSKFSLLGSGRRRRNKNCMKSRFSMYNGTVRKDAYWKRAAAALAKKKFNVQSKYKTSQFKHRPPVDKSVQPKPLLKPKIIEKKSSTVFKAKSGIDDSNITTMMQIQKEKEQKLGTIDSLSSFPKSQCSDRVKNDALTPLVDQLIDTFGMDKNKEMSQEHIRSVLQGIADDACRSEDTCAAKNPKQQEEVPPERMVERDTGKELVEKLFEVIKSHSTQKFSKKEKEEVVEVKDETAAVKKKKKKERKKTVTISGAKNAQLICIKDEDSILTDVSSRENSPSPKRSPSRSPRRTPRTPSSPRKKRHLQVRNESVNVASKETNAHVSEPTIQEMQSVKRVGSTERISKIKISRLPKVPLHPLKMLPKKFALNILEYKINYLKARKGNHMYKKSTFKQPWTLMAEISDRILEELLQVIGSELQVNHLIDNIFASEFV